MEGIQRTQAVQEGEVGRACEALKTSMALGKIYNTLNSKSLSASNILIRGWSVIYSESVRIISVVDIPICLKSYRATYRVMSMPCLCYHFRTNEIANKILPDFLFF